MSRIFGARMRVTETTYDDFRLPSVTESIGVDPDTGAFHAVDSDGRTTFLAPASTVVWVALVEENA